MEKNGQTPLSAKQTDVFHIQDSNQKVLVLRDKILIATPHRDHVTPVTLESLPCRDEEYLVGNQGTALYLGIKGNDLCLFCEESEGKPILKLKDKKIEDLYHLAKAQKPFVFYRNQTGSTSTLESAAYPGWFMCTSNDQDQPVMMTQDRGTHYNTAFYLSS